MNKPLYDPKCEELARHFLSNLEGGTSEEEIAQLARHIQQAIEDFLGEL